MDLGRGFRNPFDFYLNLGMFILIGFVMPNILLKLVQSFSNSVPKPLMPPFELVLFELDSAEPTASLTESFPNSQPSP